MLLTHRLLSGAILIAAISVSTTLPATAATQQTTGRAALAPPPVCLDATDSRANGTQVRLWQCIEHANQRFVIDNGQIKVKDTLT